MQDIKNYFINELKLMSTDDSKNLGYNVAVCREHLRSLRIFWIFASSKRNFLHWELKHYPSFFELALINSSVKLIVPIANLYFASSNGK